MTYRLFIMDRAYSSWSLRGHLLLDAFDLPFAVTHAEWPSPEFDALKAEIAPGRTVPALKIGDDLVWDSLAIAEYCAEQAPDAGLWPADAAARAVARSVSAEMHAGFQALRGAWPMNLKRKGPALAPDPAVAADIARISAIWADCRARFGADRPGGGPFLFGDWCAADAMYAPVVSRFVSYVAPLDPQATAYCAAVMNHPLMREWSEHAASETWTISDIDAL